MSTLFQSELMDIEPGWIDFNGHLNMAYYGVLFDRGADQVYPTLGFGPEYAAKRRLTTYTAEFHIRYIRELHLGDRVFTTFRLVDFDAKRFHALQELHHMDGWLAATGESMTLHVDMTGPRVTPMDADTLARLEKMADAHARVPLPPKTLSRAIAIPNSTRRP